MTRHRNPVRASRIQIALLRVLKYEDDPLPARELARQVGVATMEAAANLAVLRALARQGGVTCVAFEDPGYGSAQTDETIRAVLGMGIDVTYVPVDEQGLVVSELNTSGAQAVVVSGSRRIAVSTEVSPPPDNIRKSGQTKPSRRSVASRSARYRPISGWT